MRKLYNYKILLVLWISLGVSVSGYFYIFPNRYEETSDFNSPGRRHYRAITYSRDGKEQQVFTLITIVGAILIFGIGSNISSKKEIS